MSELVQQLQERDNAIRSHHEFRTGRSMPKPMTLEGMAAGRIAELEAALRGLLNYVDRYADRREVAVASEIKAARKILTPES